MSSLHTSQSRTTANPNSSFHIVVLAGLVAFLSYLAATLGGAAATNGMAGLARLRNSSCDFAPYAEADMASVTRCGAGRVWHL
jgi:hypothetical protein